MPRIDIGQLTLNYVLEGAGPETVVLINGLADDVGTWERQVPALLSAGYRVLRFDNRGIGKSDCPPGPYTTSEMAADTKALITRLGIGRFHLVGLSMGGMIAQHYALAHGGDLKSLSLCCTYASPGPFCSRMFSLWADMAPVMGVPTVMRDVVLWAFTQSFFANPQTEFEELEAALAGLDQPVAAYLAQQHASRTHDTTALLDNIDTPTMVMAAEEDFLIPVPQTRALCDLIPGAQWSLCEGGHAAQWERPESFNRQLFDFLGAQRR